MLVNGKMIDKMEEEFIIHQMEMYMKESLKMEKFFSGHGKFIMANGDQYNGQWQNDAKHGHGIYIWANGCKYEGDYKLGEREGIGIYHFEDKSVYIGQWKSGKRHGRGIKKDINGNLFLQEINQGQQVNTKKINDQVDVPDFLKSLFNKIT